MLVKTGARLKSTVCDAEVMIISAPANDIDLSCGGAPMADAKTAVKNGEPHADHAQGIQIGKRYVSEAGDLEVLCVKAGKGSLAVSGSPLKAKDAKKLPKSD